jgi:hypothetical protein
MSSGASKDKARKPTPEPVDITTMFKELNDRITSMALQFDDNIKAIGLTTERSLSTIHEDIEHANRALNDLSVARNDHAKILRDLETQIVSVEARLDVSGESSKDPNKVPEGQGASSTEKPQGIKHSRPNKPSYNDKPKNKPFKQRSSKPSKYKGKSKSKHPGSDYSSSDSSSSGSEGSPKWSPSSDTEDEDSSDNEASKKESRNARFPGLKAIEPRNELFTEALSYRTYRLNNQSQRYDSNVAKDLYSYCKKVKPDVPEEFYFSGQDPLAILRFLTSFKLGCDHNGISEGAALRMLPKFMTGQAQRNMINFTSRATKDNRSYYPCAIQYLLQTYADEDRVEDEYNKLHRFKQKVGEDEREFASRIRTHAVRLGHLYTDNVLTSAFLAGIDSRVRAFFRGSPSGGRDFDSVVAQCYQGGRAVTNEHQPSLDPPPRRVPRTILTARTNPAALLATAENHRLPPTPPSTQLNNDTRADFRRGTVQRTESRNSACHLCRDPNHWIQECPLLTVDQRNQAKQNAIRQPQPPRSTMHPNLPLYTRGRPSERTTTAYLVEEAGSIDPMFLTQGDNLDETSTYSNSEN